MESVESVELLNLLVPTKCFLYPRGDHATIFGELGIIKPLDELVKLWDNWDSLVVRSCIEELAKCSKHEFLINCGPTQIPRLCFSLFVTLCLSPRLLR